MSTRNSDIRQSLAVAFANGWTAAGNPAAVEYENSKTNQAKGTLWVRFLIRQGLTVRADLGSQTQRMRRTVGLAVLEVYVPVIKATQPGIALVDTFIGIFDEKTFTITGGNIVMRTTSMQMIGNRPADDWMQITASCPFKADVIE